MDKLLSNLDAKLRVATCAEIIKRHQRIQTTILYVTHDQVEAQLDYLIPTVFFIQFVLRQSTLVIIDISLELAC